MPSREKNKSCHAFFGGSWRGGGRGEERGGGLNASVGSDSQQRAASTFICSSEILFSCTFLLRDYSTPTTYYEHGVQRTSLA